MIIRIQRRGGALTKNQGLAHNLKTEDVHIFQLSFYHCNKVKNIYQGVVLFNLLEL